MVTAWFVSSLVIAGLSIIILVANVCIGYSDGWVTADGKRFIRWSILGLLLSPTGFFVVPLAATAGILWLVFKIIKGAVIFGFVKDVPIDDESGMPKEKYSSSIY